MKVSSVLISIEFVEAVSGVLTRGLVISSVPKNSMNGVML